VKIAASIPIPAASLPQKGLVQATVDGDELPGCLAKAIADQQEIGFRLICKRHTGGMLTIQNAVLNRDSDSSASIGSRMRAHVCGKAHTTWSRSLTFGQAAFAAGDHYRLSGAAEKGCMPAQRRHFGLPPPSGATFVSSRRCGNVRREIQPIAQPKSYGHLAERGDRQAPSEPGGDVSRTPANRV
jgi:hypothetical protein